MNGAREKDGIKTEIRLEAQGNGGRGRTNLPHRKGDGLIKENVTCLFPLVLAACFLKFGIFLLAVHI